MIEWLQNSSCLNEKTIKISERLTPKAIAYLIYKSNNDKQLNEIWKIIENHKIEKIFELILKEVKELKTPISQILRLFNHIKKDHILNIKGENVQFKIVNILLEVIKLVSFQIFFFFLKVYNRKIFLY